MDYSQDYFKMSDHPLIQKHFKYISGDFVARKVSDEFKVVFILHNGNKSYIELSGENYVWLPRQDQIQIFFGCHFGVDDIMSPVCHFASHILSERPEDDYLRLDTPEKNWLAFYMKEIHKLTWDGDKWRKDPKRKSA